MPLAQLVNSSKLQFPCLYSENGVGTSPMGLGKRETPSASTDQLLACVHSCRMIDKLLVSKDEITVYYLRNYIYMTS